MANIIILIASLSSSLLLFTSYGGEYVWFESVLFWENFVMANSCRNNFYTSSSNGICLKNCFCLFLSFTVFLKFKYLQKWLEISPREKPSLWISQTFSDPYQACSAAICSSVFTWWIERTRKKLLDSREREIITGPIIIILTTDSFPVFTVRYQYMLKVYEGKSLSK